MFWIVFENRYDINFAMNLIILTLLTHIFCYLTINAIQRIDTYAKAIKHIFTHKWQWVPIMLIIQMGLINQKRIVLASESVKTAPLSIP